MIRWLQTTLFGDRDGLSGAPEAKPARPSTRIPTRGKGSSAGTTHTTRNATHDAAPDAALLARWAAVAPDITLEPAPRLRQGWQLTWKRGPGGERGVHGIRLRVPAALRAAPDDILLALSAWARLAVQRRSPARRAERLALEKRLHAWLDAHHAADARLQKLKHGRAVRKLDRLVTQGRHHDLQAVYDAINAEYFGGALQARVTWASRWGGLSTQKDIPDGRGGTVPLLTISRGYDHPSATTEIVGGVVYHECLHIAVPPREGNGRRIVHSREFRRREKEYRFYDVWRTWHAEKLPGIIRRGGRG